MNILAKEQQRASDPALSPVERARRQEQFYNLYYKLRHREESRWSSRLSLQQRQNDSGSVYAQEPAGRLFL